MPAEHLKHPDPYDPKTEHLYNWFYNQITGEWVSSPKENKRTSFKSFVETRANHEGVQIRKVGTEKWIPVSELFTPPVK